MFKRAEPRQIAQARGLRREMTKAEKRLWWKLRELNRMGHHFRKQAPFDIYVLDFVEHDARLVIEMDGSQHGLELERARDRRRDAFLQGEGYLTLRFWNDEVFDDLDRVTDAILRSLESRKTKEDET